jgi:hypothetical protein
MAGSNLSVHGDRHDDDGIPVARAELRQMENSLLAAMERMFNERLPTMAVGISNTIITPHLMQKLVMKTQVLDMNFMATLVVVVVVGGMLVVTTGVDEDAVVAAMCSLTMRSLKILMLIMMIMQILLQHMGHMGSAMSTVVVQVIMWNIITVVTIEMIRIILLESS